MRRQGLPSSSRATDELRGYERRGADAENADAVLLGDGLEGRQLALATAVGVTGVRGGEERQDDLLALEGAQGGLLETATHEGEVGGCVADGDSLQAGRRWWWSTCEEIDEWE